MTRGSGKTHKVIYQALMSDEPIIFIFAPTDAIRRHMMATFKDHAGKPSQITDTMIQIADRRYVFHTVHPGVHRCLIGVDKYDTFFDHSVFELDSSEEFVLQELQLMREITLAKARKDDGTNRSNAR